MRTVREWGATFWADETYDQEALEVLAGAVEHQLLSEVPDAVILDRSVKGRVPPVWEGNEDGYQYVGVLIKYTSETQDAE